MPNRFATLLSNAKTRTLVLVVIVILVIGVVIAVSQSGSTSNTAATERVSKTAEIPANVRSTPGEKVSRKYQELQEQANIRGAEEAAKKGETFIPTVVGASEGYDDTDFEKQLSTAFDDLGGKCSKEEIERLRTQGKDIAEIVLQLKCYGCSAEAIGSLFTCNEITAALIAAKGCPGNITGCGVEVVKDMQKLGYNATKIAAALKANGCKGAEVAKAIRSAGFTANEVAAAMHDSGFTSAEIAQGLKDAGDNINQIAQALKSINVPPTEIAQALNAAGFDRGQTLAALQQAGFSPLEIAKAISALDLEGADAAALLAQQQASNDEVRRAAAQQEAQNLAQFSQQRQAKIEDLLKAMDTQKTSAIQAWETIAQQSYVEGEWAQIRPTAKQLLADKTAAAGAKTGSAGGTGTTAPGSVILKAGTILFGVLDTAVNSDEPGPVLATIVSGSLKGARLMGSMSINIDGENIALNFTAINMPGEKKSMGISAVAIDPDTARTALATDVDHHYLLRWGSLFASAFLEGYASAVASAGQTQTVSQGAAGTVTNTTTPALSGRQQLFQGLAAIGTKWSEVVGRNFDRPITITIDQGTGIGVLITADLEYGKDPVYYTPGAAVTSARVPSGLNQPAQAPQNNTIGSGVTAEQAAAFLNALQTVPSNNMASSTTTSSTTTSTTSSGGK